MCDSNETPSSEACRCIPDNCQSNSNGHARDCEARVEHRVLSEKEAPGRDLTGREMIWMMFDYQKQANSRHSYTDYEDLASVKLHGKRLGQIGKLGGLSFGISPSSLPATCLIILCGYRLRSMNSSKMNARSILARPRRIPQRSPMKC